MRIKDALKAMIGQKERTALNPMTTRWSEHTEDEREIPLQEYPRPQMMRREWDCLNGWWEYAFTEKDRSWSGAEGQILVPFSPETTRSRVGRTLRPGEKLWYRREIPVPELRPRSRLLLHFGAVDERCAVWWNRKRLGSHRGGYLPFSFDVTEALRAGMNELLVCVLDDTDTGSACRGKQKLAPGGMFYAAQSGIWQTVWTEWVPENAVEELKILPQPDEGETEFLIRMRRSAAGEVLVGAPRVLPVQEVSCGPALSLKDAWSSPEEEWRNFNVPVSGCTVSEEDFDSDGWVRCRLKIDAVRLWSPEHPALYPVKIRLGDDEISSYFALRSFGTGTDENGPARLTLNGKPYFFHGVLDQGYWPESLMTAPSDEAFRYDILRAKEAGFNMIRKHAKIEPLRWYYHCDRLGMAVWQDMVNGGGPIGKWRCMYLPTAFPVFGRLVRDHHYRFLRRTDRKERKRFEEQLLRMVRVLGNEPCIGMWVIFNEGWGQFDSARLWKAVKEADPSRPVDAASGWFDQGAGDVRSVHNYFRELIVEGDPARRTSDGQKRRPFVISEYGGMTSRIPGHTAAEGVYGYHDIASENFPGEFAALMKKVRRLAAEGLSGAVYTQISDIEEEVNGLVTYDRQVVKTQIEGRKTSP